FLQSALDARSDRIGAPRLDEDGRVTRHFGHGAGGCGDDRRSGSHRFENGQSEAFVTRGEHETGLAPVQRGELVVLHMSGELDASLEPKAPSRAPNLLAAALLGSDDDEAEVAVE